MHRPSEPESLRRGAKGDTDAPCVCNCVKSSEPGTDQPQSTHSTVDAALYAVMGGEP